VPCTFQNHPYALLEGPSAIATVMLLTGQDPSRWLDWLAALLLAWSISSVILMVSARLDRLFGERGLTALQHLMGLILTALAVEMFIEGVATVFQV